MKLCNYPDFVALQETHLGNYDTEKEWNLQLRKHYRTFFSRGKQGERGTAILIGINVPFKMILEIEDINGRYTILKGNLMGELVTLVSIYGPLDNSAKGSFFNEIIDMDLRGILYIMGDFNAVTNVDLDRSNKKASADRALILFMEKLDIVDIWREKNPTTILYSWTSVVEGKFRGSRLDMIAVSRAARKCVRKIDYYESGFSDHHLVWMEIETSKPLMGREVFCIKPYVFEDENFHCEFNELIERETVRLKEKLYDKFEKRDFIGSIEQILHEIEDGVDITKGLLLKNLELDGEWWEGFKNRVRNIASRIQRESRCMDSVEYRALQRDLGRCKNYRDLGVLKAQIKSKLREITKKEIFMEKIEHITNDEKCTSIFFKRVAEGHKINYLDNVVTEGGKILEKQEEIKKYLWQKYAQLYKKRQINEQFDNIFINKLPQVEDGILGENDITYDEMRDAIKEMKTGSSPGMDGIGVDFYKKYFYKFGAWFCSMYNNCTKTGKIPNSWEMATLRLIPKAEGIPDFNKLRPLGLGGVDKKIPSKALANRLRGVLPNIIDESQTGGIAGRNIANGTLLIHLLIQFYTKHEERGYILGIDGSKAYDCVDRDKLWKVLENYNFPLHFINQLK